MIDRWRIRGIRRIRRDREGGDVALEMVLLAPIIIFMIFVVIQFALWYHARHVVTVAAQEGARVARASNTSAAAAERAGRDRAYAFIDTIGGSIVEDPNVVVNRGAATVTVRVTGTAIHIVPGLRLQVRGQSAGPVERFVPPS
ncbi:MAG TPA: TadE/TadG family type IV pilus assembly protein [Actinomycetes bacterium]|nr:TadE/TadG family type IV pilus assembly protein [Actinomycetes bacterium]